MNQNTDVVPFSLPSIGQEEENAVLNVLRSGWLTTGTIAQEFEHAFSEILNAKHALAVNSGTAGLHIALEAAGISKGSRVFTSTYTFTATAEVARYLGADPVFVDISEEGFNIDPQSLDSKLKIHAAQKSCIIPVHIAGQLCDMNHILQTATEHRATVIEDCAHAFPVSADGKMAGTFGAAGMFSFYATKTITTGEGGMVVTNDDTLAERMSVLRLHGIDRPIWDRYSGTRANSWEYDVVAAGYKYNMTDMAAAMGVEQLKKAQKFKRMRTLAVRRYQDGLSDVDFISIPEATEDHAWHLLIAQLVPGKLTVARDEFIELMRQQGIHTSVHFKPLHLMTYYRERYNLKPEDFPRATERYTRVMSLPLFPDITEDQIERVISAVKSIGETRRRRTVHAGC